MSQFFEPKIFRVKLAESRGCPIRGGDENNQLVILTFSCEEETVMVGIKPEDFVLWLEDAKRFSKLNNLK